MRARLLTAFAAVYLVWGSTYLAIRFAVETLPPLLMGGASSTGALVLVLASLSWAIGSLYIQWAPKAPSGISASGSQMLAGGLVLLVAGVVAHEPSRLDLAHASTRSLLGFAYLVTIGS